jgi:hypothetical protein
VRREITSRLQLPFHQRVPVPQATVNTMRYLFFHMRASIYVQIRGGELQAFAPFANRDYTNTWGGGLQLEARYSDLAEYNDAKTWFFPRAGGKQLPDPTSWCVTKRLLRVAMPGPEASREAPPSRLPCVWPLCWTWHGHERMLFREGTWEAL